VPSFTFSIQPMVELDSVRFNVAVDDVLFNLVTKDTQLMRGSTPWRRGREKDPLLLQLLIESTTQIGDIVLDCTASTSTLFLLTSLSWPCECFFLFFCLYLPCFFAGTSVHACRKTGRYFVAMEGDKEIFKAILEPFIVAPVTEGFKKQQLDANGPTEDLQVEELPDSIVVA
jgi:hypothetical protein